MRTMPPFLPLILLASLCAGADDRFAWAAGFLARPGSGMALAVDAGELPDRGLLHARLLVPVTPGGALVYPLWVPGTHVVDMDRSLTPSYRTKYRMWIWTGH